MKLLGGISSQQPPVNDALSSAAAERADETVNPAPQNAIQPETEHRNVMADVIERHERIANRARRTH